MPGSRPGKTRLQASRQRLHPRRHPEAAKAARAVQSIAALRIAAMLKRSSPDMPDWMLSAAAKFIMSGLHAIALWWLDNKTVEKKALVDLIAGLAWQGVSVLGTGGDAENARATGSDPVGPASPRPD